MSEYTKQYKFTHDTRFDFNTSYTMDDSIRYLMGDLQGQLREDAQHAEYPDDFVELSYCEILELQQENAQTAFVNASALRKLRQKGKHDADDEEVTDEQFAEIESELHHATEELELYHKFLCDIVDELAKGVGSELRIDLRYTKNPDYPYITFSSLKAWAKSKYPDYDCKISNGLPTNQNEVDPDDKSINSFLITFALLLEAFAAKTAKYKNDDGSLKKDPIAKELSKLAEKNPNLFKGQSISAITDRINKAIKAKQEANK